jgi:hypothetical protein
VVFTVINTSSFDAAEMRIATVGPTGGVHVPLGQGAKAIFAPPGYLLIRTGTGSLDAQPFNPARRQATGRRQTILSGLTSGIFNNSGEFAVGADGHLVYITDPFEGDREVVTVSRNGAARSLPSGWIGNFESVSLSPDGRRIAAGTYTAANEEVQVRHLASGATRRSVSRGRSCAIPHGRRPETRSTSPLWGPGTTVSIELDWAREPWRHGSLPRKTSFSIKRRRARMDSCSTTRLAA